MLPSEIEVGGKYYSTYEEANIVVVYYNPKNHPESFESCCLVHYPGGKRGWHGRTNKRFLPRGYSGPLSNLYWIHPGEISESPDDYDIDE